MGVFALGNLAAFHPDHTPATAPLTAAGGIDGKSSLDRSVEKQSALSNLSAFPLGLEGHAEALLQILTLPTA
ncbi:unnamed protein product, partial [marine sediment metagenome]